MRMGPTLFTIFFQHSEQMVPQLLLGLHLRHGKNVDFDFFVILNGFFDSRHNLGSLYEGVYLITIIADTYPFIFILLLKCRL